MTAKKASLRVQPVTWKRTASEEPSERSHEKKKLAYGQLFQTIASVTSDPPVSPLSHAAVARGS